MKKFNINYLFVFVVLNVLIIGLYISYASSNTQILTENGISFSNNNYYANFLVNKISNLEYRDRLYTEGNIDKNFYTNVFIELEPETREDYLFIINNNSNKNKVFYNLIHNAPDGVTVGVNEYNTTYNLNNNYNNSLNNIKSMYDMNNENNGFDLLFKNIIDPTRDFEININNPNSFIENGSINYFIVTINNSLVENARINFNLQSDIEESLVLPPQYGYITDDYNGSDNNYFNFDSLGVNKPELVDGMYPVIYDKLNSKWVIANSNNICKSTECTQSWYNYKELKYANVALVKEESRYKYNDLLPGTEIMESDILGYFVWIPRFSYKIFSTDGSENYEKMIEVEFANRFSKEPTVVCTDTENNILYSYANKYAEICTDTKYGKLRVGSSIYMHPSFLNMDNNYINGYWVSKFPSPNAREAKYIPNNSVKVSDKYEVLDEKTNASTEMMNSNYYIEDYESINTYPMTSYNYGALAILANSQYGKIGNSYIFGSNHTFNNVFNNPSEDTIGLSTCYNGRNTSMKDTCLDYIYYNDLTSYEYTLNGVLYKTGELGPGASHTGTIYGVYDLSGGVPKTIFGLTNKQYKSFSTSYPNFRYDGYMQNSNHKNYQNLFRYGDGIKEFVKTYRMNGMWNGGSIKYPGQGEKIMLRGGSSENGSLFTMEFKKLNNVENNEEEDNIIYSIIEITK